ncbi:hypothetical protein [Desulfotalea psychrophila]|uniref:Additional component NikL of nickel ECF transporter n=1 Tax=Desulfotalea psychrophila (strain LSv54 / DSM 12343) TaxID=177439 RepID=Q6AQ85_DESPS|nr:hypothetical protein [Desulfotalea psychrophila]CAG35488.1 unknown protein [Desulfotalea psychrophila LSv54]
MKLLKKNSPRLQKRGTGQGLFWLFTFTTIFFLAATAQAHKVRVFAYKDGTQITCESEFSGGRAAQLARIEVLRDGRVIIQGSTNQDGIFHFPIPIKPTGQSQDLKIVVNAGNGHRGEWLLRGEDYLDNAPVAQAPQTPSPQRQEKTVPELSVTITEVEKIVRRELNKQLSPIRRHLAAQAEAGPSLQDIFGGIGYIIGLAGIAAYLQSRKK